MSDDAKPPDYTTMSGAEFRRAVGADPEKWATAFSQRAAAMSELISDDLQDELAQWFRDFGAAVVAAYPPVVVPPGHWAIWPAPEKE